MHFQRTLRYKHFPHGTIPLLKLTADTEFNAVALPVQMRAKSSDEVCLAFGTYTQIPRTAARLVCAYTLSTRSINYDGNLTSPTSSTSPSASPSPGVPAFSQSEFASSPVSETPIVDSGFTSHDENRGIGALPTAQSCS